MLTNVAATPCEVAERFFEVGALRKPARFPGSLLSLVFLKGSSWHTRFPKVRHSWSLINIYIYIKPLKKGRAPEEKDRLFQASAMAFGKFIPKMASLNMSNPMVQHNATIIANKNTYTTRNQVVCVSSITTQNCHLQTPEKTLGRFLPRTQLEFPMF